MNARSRWGQPAAGWDTPGWAPLVDPGPLPLQTARSVGRWLWFTAVVGGFLLVTGFTLAHDDPAPGLSLRGVLTIALAAAVVVLLTLHRTGGPRLLARVLGEYTVVFLLAVLVATTGITLDHPTGRGGKQASAAVDHRPPLVKTIDSWRDRLVGAGAWLAELWRRADPEAGRRHRPPSTTTPPNHGQAMPPSPALSPRPGGRYDLEVL